MLRAAYGRMRRVMAARGGLSRRRVGLQAALAERAEKFRRRTGVPAMLAVAPTWRDEVLSPRAQTTVLKLVDEALANVRRHAAAQCVHIRLAIVAGHAQIHVEDDGRGFFLSRQLYRLQHPGFCRPGLCRMRDLALALGGAFRIQARPGRGTCVAVRIPLNRWNTAIRP